VDPDAKPSGTACVSYTTKSVNDNLYLCANGINNGKYAYNNLQQYDTTWYHKFSKTVHMQPNPVYVRARRPAVGGTIKPETGANPAYCLPGEQRCTAPEYAVVNFLQKQLSVHNFLSFRSDFLDDKKGQRTGYATKYSENTIMWCHWFGTQSSFVRNCVSSAPGQESLRQRATSKSTHRSQRSDFPLLNWTLLDKTHYSSAAVLAKAMSLVNLRRSMFHN